ncbi:MAG: hypothetical protein OEW16_11065, partial [Gammaproteobacteria bacterium]|nr:hypothetical protein [Gammaproteobacteria bacterium]
MLQVLRSGLLALATMAVASGAAAANRFTITYPAGMSDVPLTGRLLLIVAPAGEQEPRLMVNWDQDAVPVFGMDVSNWKAGEKKV